MLRRLATVAGTLAALAPAAGIGGWWLRVQQAATAVPVIAALSPGNGWDGTASSCAAPSAADTSIHGSGWAEKPTLNFDTAPYTWAESGPITVGALAHVNPASGAGLDRVRFYLCGSTVDVTARSDNPANGVRGYVVSITPPVGLNGDADLYADAIPVNGKVRRYGPLRLTLNNGATNKLVRPVLYLEPNNPASVDPASRAACPNYASMIDPTSGIVTAPSGTAVPGTQATPFQTVQWAAVCGGYATSATASGSNSALGGAVVLYGAGTTSENNGAVYPQPKATIRSVSFRPETGVNLGDFVVSNATRSQGSGLGLVNYHTDFTGVKVDLGKVLTVRCTLANCTANFDHSQMSDANGVFGPCTPTSDTTYNDLALGGKCGTGTVANGYSDASPQTFIQTANARYAVTNSSAENFVFTGAQLMIHDSVLFAFDFSALGGPTVCQPAQGCPGMVSSGNSDTAIVNVTAAQPSSGKLRLNADTERNGAGLLKISAIQPYAYTGNSDAYCNPNNPVHPKVSCYVITWTNPDGTTPKISGSGGGAALFYVEMTSGACAGFNNKFPMVVQAASPGGTNSVYGLTAGQTIVSGVSPYAGGDSTTCAAAYDGSGNATSNLGLQINDVGFVWGEPHPDCNQLVGQSRGGGSLDSNSPNVPYPNFENIIEQQFKCTGTAVQPFLLQAGIGNYQFLGPSTISVSGNIATSDTLTLSSAFYSAPVSTSFDASALRTTITWPAGANLTACSSAAACATAYGDGVYSGAPRVAAQAGSNARSTLSATVTTGSPGVINATSHGLVTNQTVRFPSIYPSGLQPNVTYYVVSAGLTANSFQLASTPGGQSLAMNSSPAGLTFSTNEYPVVSATATQTMVAGDATGMTQGVFTDNYGDLFRINWAGSPTLNAAGGTVGLGPQVGYQGRFLIHGGPLDGCFYKVTAQDNTAKTSTLFADSPVRGSCTVAAAANVCSGAACSGVTAQAPLETIPGNFFSVYSSGAQTAEYAQVVSTPNSSFCYGGTGSTCAGGSNSLGNLDDVSATLTAVNPAQGSAFSQANLTSLQFSLVRSVKDFSIVSSEIYSDSVQAQMGNGTQNLSIVQSTVWGGNVQTQYGNDYGIFKIRNGGEFGTLDSSIYDSVFKGFAADYDSSGKLIAIPGKSGGMTFVNGLQLENKITGTVVPSGFTVDTSVVLDNSSTSDLGLPLTSMAAHLIGHAPWFDRSLDGVPVNSMSVVGARQPQ